MKVAPKGSMRNPARAAALPGRVTGKREGLTGSTRTWLAAPDGWPTAVPGPRSSDTAGSSGPATLVRAETVAGRVAPMPLESAGR